MTQAIAKLLPDVVLQLHCVNNKQIGFPFVQSRYGVLAFVDISGFTTLCERAGQEGSTGVDTLTRTLNAVMESIVQGLLLSEADIIHFAGDALLALWPCEESNKSEIVEKAIHCCLGIHEWTVQHQQNQRKRGVGIDIHLSVGIKIGLALGIMNLIHLQFGEEKQFMAIGSAIQDVSCAQQYATKGQIVICSNCAKECTRQFTIVDVEQGFFRVIQTMSCRRRSIKSQWAKWMSLISMRQNRLMKTKPEPLLDMVRLLPTSTEQYDWQQLRGYIPRPVILRLYDNADFRWQAELRIVTSLFINLTVLQTLGVISIAHLLQHVFEKIAGTVRRLTGTVAKCFAFDKGYTFLVVFGLPGQKQKRGGRRALRLALSLHEDVLHVKGVLAVSIGIATGRVYCGVVGHPFRHEYTIIGDSVNTAARLMTAFPGSIVCDSNTHVNAQPMSCFEVLSNVSLRGKAYVGDIYRVNLERAQASIFPEGNDNSCSISPSQSQENIINGIIGRNSCLSQFVRLLRNSNSRNKVTASAFHVVGRPGMGKSSTLDILEVICKDHGVEYLSVLCHSAAHTTPFHTVKTLLKQCLYEKTKESPSTQKDILSRWLKSAGHVNISAGVELLTQFLHLEPLSCLLKADKKSCLYSHEICTTKNVDGPVVKNNSGNIDSFMKGKVADGLEIRRLLRKIFTNVARKKVIMLDNAEWCDSSSWDIIMAAAGLRDTKNSSIRLFTFTSRSNATWHSRQTNDIASLLVESYVLEPLTDAQMVQLVCAQLDVSAIPQHVARFLSEQAKGNPFHCKQLLYSLQERGALKLSESNIFEEKADTSTSIISISSSPSCTSQLTVPGQVLTRSTSRLLVRAESTRLFETIQIPESLNDVLLQRFDQLPATTLLVLKCAAIVGTEFYLRDLMFFSGITGVRHSLIQHLLQLDKAELLEIVTKPQLGMMTQCRFCQELIQITAYDLWPPSTRASLHAHYAQSLESWAHQQQRRSYIENYVRLKNKHTAQFIPAEYQQHNEFTNEAEQNEQGKACTYQGGQELQDCSISSDEKQQRDINFRGCSSPRNCEEHWTSRKRRPCASTENITVGKKSPNILLPARNLVQKEPDQLLEEQKLNGVFMAHHWKRAEQPFLAAQYLLSSVQMSMSFDDVDTALVLLDQAKQLQYEYNLPRHMHVRILGCFAEVYALNNDYRNCVSACLDAITILGIRLNSRWKYRTAQQLMRRNHQFRFIKKREIYSKHKNFDHSKSSPEISTTQHYLGKQHEQSKSERPYSKNFDLQLCSEDYLGLSATILSQLVSAYQANGNLKAAATTASVLVKIMVSSRRPRALFDESLTFLLTFSQQAKLRNLCSWCHQQVSISLEFPATQEQLLLLDIQFLVAFSDGDMERAQSAVKQALRICEHCQLSEMKTIMRTWQLLASAYSGNFLATRKSFGSHKNPPQKLKAVQNFHKNHDFCQPKDINDNRFTKPISPVIRNWKPEINEQNTRVEYRSFKCSEEEMDAIVPDFLHSRKGSLTKTVFSGRLPPLFVEKPSSQVTPSKSEMQQHRASYSTTKQYEIDSLTSTSSNMSHSDNHHNKISSVSPPQMRNRAQSVGSGETNCSYTSRSSRLQSLRRSVLLSESTNLRSPSQSVCNEQAEAALAASSIINNTQRPSQIQETNSVEAPENLSYTSAEVQANFATQDIFYKLFCIQHSPMSLDNSNILSTVVESDSEVWSASLEMQHVLRACYACWHAIYGSSGEARRHLSMIRISILSRSSIDALATSIACLAASIACARWQCQELLNKSFEFMNELKRLSEIHRIHKPRLHICMAILHAAKQLFLKAKRELTRAKLVARKVQNKFDEMWCDHLLTEMDQKRHSTQKHRQKKNKWYGPDLSHILFHQRP